MAKPPKPEALDGRTPLSFAQQRLWFLDRIEERSDLYNIPLIFELDGHLDTDALRRSIDTIVSRHEVLRTSFPTDDGVPYQAIAPASVPTAEDDVNPAIDPDSSTPSWEWTERDLGEVGDEEALAELLKTEAWRPFDLAVGPLFRVGLYRRSKEKHVLQVVMHHTVSDGWSVGVFKRELSSLYPAFTAGKPSPLPSLPVQYADYANWQQEWLKGENLEAQMGYWRSRLAGLMPLDLPTDRPRPPVQRYVGGTHHFRLAPQLASKLRALGRREGSTLFMTLMAAFQVLLHRYSGQADIAVGTPMAGRVRSEFEGLMGMFVNTLVIRSDLSGDPSFRELLADVRTSSLELLDHQDLPFEKLVEELQPERDMSRNPLFQVSFALQNAPDRGMLLPGLEVKNRAVEGRPAKFDLSLDLRDSAGQNENAAIEGTWTYAKDLFDASTIKRMQTHFQVLLEGIVADPDASVKGLPLMEAEERRVLVEEWGRGPEVEVPDGVAIHHLFEARVEEDPDRMAVVAQDGRLTYGELNSKANRLARRLMDLGVGPDTLVGVALARTTDMVVTVMSVLKAGGAYLPLDPDLPPERLAYMMEDGDASVLVTHTSVLKSFSSFAGEVVCLDRDSKELRALPDTNPNLAVDPEQLAYVLYTSGSTGRPKGVEVRHRNVVAYLASYVDRPGLTAEDVFLSVATLSFDVSVLEFFGSLAVGARIELASWEAVRDGHQLRTIIEENGVTVLNCTPATLYMLLDAGWTGRKALRVWAGSEAVPTDLVKKLMVGCGEVWNLYGPTETTVTTTAWRVPEDVEEMRIGTPLGNYQVYVVDDRMEPLPVGVPGELCIGGVGVARGYRKRPELTAERFVPDVFGTEPGVEPSGLLYRTGDQVRFRDDGTLDFMGRLDGQVKIRGLRIELGEIESMLLDQEAVRQVAVLVHGEGVDSRLVAYVVFEEGGQFDLREMRRILREFLPDYMVPSLLIELDEFPLTPSGKVDRRALPDPGTHSQSEAEAFVAPRTEMEKTLASVWAEILEKERVGIHDDFFGLGGHSLMATRVMSRVAQVLEIELPLRTLFESPTVGELAERIEALDPLSVEGPPPIEPFSGDTPVPLSFAQQRLWFLDRIEERSDLYNIPMTFELAGQLDKNALWQSLDAIVQRHEALRTHYPEVDGVPYQVVAPTECSGFWEWKETDAGAFGEEELEECLRARARRPFDLANGPLFRGELFQRDEELHVLHVNMHHSVSDGWSIGVFKEELSTLYSALRAGQPSPLSPLKIQYADFAVWQQEWLQGEVLERQLDYWRQKLDGLAPLDLPTDRPRPPVQRFHGRAHPIHLPAELANGLRALSQGEGSTLFMTLMAAFHVLLHRYSGQADIAVGTPIAGRNRVELEGLMGMFVNTLVMRSDLSENPSFRDLLRQIRSTSLEAHSHQDLPFERLVEELQPQRDMSRNPLFQVMFALQNAPGGELTLPGLEVRSLPIFRETPKTDLSIGLHEATAPDKEGAIEGNWVYATDLFDASTIQRMQRHFQVLLEGIVADPDAPVSDLALMGEAEREVLVEEWAGGTEVEAPAGVAIHHLFEARVAEDPDRVAVVGEDGSLTYGELNTKANQLAHRLVELGVGKETLVGVGLDRTTEMVVGVMGVLKAGGAYLPLDPNLPAERLGYMLEDGNAAALVTHTAVLESFPSFPGHVICLDQVDQELEGFPATGPDVVVDPEQLAYVLYTSGSTGRPKGVEVRHRNVVSFLVSLMERPGLRADDVFLGVATLAFDASIMEIFGSLAVGAHMVVASWEAVRDGPRLRALMEETGVTVAFLTPATLAMLLDAGWQGNPSVRVWTGGDVVPTDLALRAMVGGGEVWNGYGPTEATVFTTTWRVPADVEQMRIGKPQGNVRAYVLDDQRQPVPVGVPGELFIGGGGVTRGYRNSPELTAERFIPDEFSKKPGARLYRSGDRVRFRDDGALEFMGRLDGQVKIRGLRIELGEIEAMLLEHEAVRQAAVLVHGERSDARLVAYVVFEEGAHFGLREMRSTLQKFLPDYMVPSLLIELHDFPLTPSGKVDRKALPDPVEAGVVEAEGFVAPRTPTEEALAGIWTEVLGRERIGIHDDFFGLGGHSLLATQVMSRVVRNLGVELPLRVLFEAPTVEELSDRIDAHRYADEVRGRSKDEPFEEIEI